ncbi:MAG: hypothetical protein ACM3ZE_03100, partial [Myxococcales bacterium]
KGNRSAKPPRKSAASFRVIAERGGLVHGFDFRGGSNVREPPGDAAGAQFSVPDASEVLGGKTTIVPRSEWVEPNAGRVNGCSSCCLQERRRRHPAQLAIACVVHSGFGFLPLMRTLPTVPELLGLHKL